MNFAEIETTWRSPQNQPSAAQLEATRIKFVTDLRRRHRGNLIFLSGIFILISAFTLKLLVQILWPNPALDSVDLTREWGVIPFFLIPWIGWGWLVWLHRRHRTRHPYYDQSINAALTALLDENRAERQRAKVVSALLFVSVLVLPLIVSQLRAVGKVGSEIAIPAFVVYPAYVVGCVVWIAFQYRRKLLTRKRELETLLASYESARPGER